MSTPRPYRRQDLTGQRFGRLVAIQRLDETAPQLKWLCRCDCGNVKAVRMAHLKSWMSTSCGCFNREVAKERGTTHGAGGKRCRTRTYTIWMLMIQRCENPRSTPYPWYGALGIKVCAAWHSFERFLADMGECPSDHHSIDRFPNKSGDYEPGNCRWATRRQQACNTRANRLIEIGGETKCLSEWCELYGKPYKCVLGRLNRGWTIDRAFGEVIKHTRIGKPWEAEGVSRSTWYRKREKEKVD